MPWPRSRSSQKSSFSLTISRVGRVVPKYSSMRSSSNARDCAEVWFVGNTLEIDDRPRTVGIGVFKCSSAIVACCEGLARGDCGPIGIAGTV